MGTHVAWAFASAIWLYLVLGLFRPVLMGSWARRCPSASSRTSTGPRPSRSATATSTTTRSTLSIVFLYGSTSAVRDARCDDPRRLSRYGGDREIEQIIRPRHGVGACGLFWRWTMGFNATMESSTAGPGGSPCSPPSRAGSASCSPARWWTTGTSGPSNTTSHPNTWSPMATKPTAATATSVAYRPGGVTHVSQVV
jgi:hypothetical protein